MIPNLVGRYGPAPAVAALLATLFVSTDSRAQRPEPTPTRGILGQAAPPLGVTQWLNLSRGVPRPRLQDYRGKVVYLYCFQSWCPACQSHGFPTLQRMVRRYQKNDDVVFLAVQTVFEGFAANTAARAESVAVGKFKLKIPVSHDVGVDGKRSALMRRYRTGGTPWTILIDRNGIVRFNGFGTRLRFAELARQVDALRAEPGLIGSEFGGLDSLRFAGSPIRFADRDFTLLRWWTDSCPNCRDSLPALEALRSRYPALEVLGVYHPKPIRDREIAAVVGDARRLKFSGPVAVDPGWKLLAALRSRGLKSRFTSVSILVDRTGVIRWVHAGPRLHDRLRGGKSDAHADAARAMTELRRLLRAAPATPRTRPDSGKRGSRRRPG